MPTLFDGTNKTLNLPNMVNVLAFWDSRSQESTNMLDILQVIYTSNKNWQPYLNIAALEIELNATSYLERSSKADVDVQALLLSKGYTSISNYRVTPTSPRFWYRFAGLKQAKTQYCVVLDPNSKIISMG
jgi:hypothetical protein